MPSTEEKLDILYKKVLYGKSISGPFDATLPNQESIASSSKVRGTDIRLADIPETPPSESGDITIYQGADVFNDDSPGGTFRLTEKEDSQQVASGLRRTWQAKYNGEDLGGWIDGSYGIGYNIRVFIGPTTSPVFTGGGSNCTEIFASTNSYYFDYDSGTFYIFDYPQTESFFTDNWGAGYSIYIRGYRYTSDATFSSMAYQNSTDVDITGGSVTGLTDFSVLNDSDQTLVSITGGNTLAIETASIDALSVNGNMTVAGDLTITGDLIQQTGTDVVFADTILELNVPSTDGVVSTGTAGIEVYRGLDGAGGALQDAAQLVWSYTDERWKASDNSITLSNILLASDTATADQANAVSSPGSELITASNLLSLYELNASIDGGGTGEDLTAIQSRYSRIASVKITLGSANTVGDFVTITHNLDTQNIMVYGYKVNSGSRLPFVPSYEVTSDDVIKVYKPTDQQNDEYYFVILG